MVDHQGPDGKPVSVFESGAMLIYLAEKTGKFMPRDPRGKIQVLECKVPMSMRVDREVSEWFKAQGSRYQSRKNAVLKAYVHAHSGEATEG